MRICGPLFFATLVVATVSGQSSTEPLPAGNETAGAAIVAGKGDCQTCHRIFGKGSRLGPDLTDIGSLRTSRAARRRRCSIPTPRFFPRTASTASSRVTATTITGRLLNLDTFQVLMLDPKEQLRTLYQIGPSRARLRRLDRSCRRFEARCRARSSPTSSRTC